MTRKEKPPRVERLGRHDRSAFCSGNDALDRYFRELVSQDARRSMASPYVAIDETSETIIGFYTLSSASVPIDQIPPHVKDKLRLRYSELPATLIGRLAVDQKYQGKGMGGFLLIDALLRSLRHSKDISSFAVIVDAKDENAQYFYEKHEFIRLLDTRDRLFIPMSSIQSLYDR